MESSTAGGEHFRSARNSLPRMYLSAMERSFSRTDPSTASPIRDFRSFSSSGMAPFRSISESFASLETQDARISSEPEEPGNIPLSTDRSPPEAIPARSK